MNSWGTIRHRTLTGPNAKALSESGEEDIEDPHAFIIPSLLIQISDLFYQANLNSNPVQSSYVSILEEIFNDGSECMGSERRKRRIVQK
jgi:hypothetical protein